METSASCIRVDQHVTDGADGADKPRLPRIIAQLLAKGGDVDINGAVKYVVIAAADLFDQLLPGFDAATAASQGREDLEFDRGQFERSIADVHCMRGDVHPQRSDHDLVNLVVLWRAR